MADGTSRPTYGPHPDAVLLRQRRMARAETAVRLAVALATPFPRESPGRPRGNGRPPVNAKSRQCPGCKQWLGPINKHFGPRGQNVHCRVCVHNLGELIRKRALEKRKARMTLADFPRTCRICHTRHESAREHFYRNRRFRATCNTCALAAIKAKHAKRRGRNA